MSDVGLNAFHYALLHGHLELCIWLKSHGSPTSTEKVNSTDTLTWLMEHSSGDVTQWYIQTCIHVHNSSASQSDASDDDESPASSPATRRADLRAARKADLKTARRIGATAHRGRNWSAGRERNWTENAPSSPTVFASAHERPQQAPA